jgi:alpha-beta hydrolase superfamily lysophospholipase
MSSKPTIAIVPGFWEGADSFIRLEPVLRSAGFKVHAASLTSTGTSSPGNPSMTDDINSLSKQLTTLVEAGDEVVVLAHSMGGVLASEAIQGLSANSRKEKPGKVTGLIFFAAGLAPEGHTMTDMPFMRKEVNLSPSSNPEILIPN